MRLSLVWVKDGSTRSIWNHNAEEEEKKEKKGGGGGGSHLSLGNKWLTVKQLYNFASVKDRSARLQQQQ